MTVDRRDFLRLSGLAAAAGTSLAARPQTPLGRTPPGSTTPPARPSTTGTGCFQQGGPGQPDQPNDNTNADGRSGMLAWSQSYVLLGLVRMYETYRDTYYLDRLIDNVDQVLMVRDSERGVTDYLGLSLPAWRADHRTPPASRHLPTATGARFSRSGRRCRTPRTPPSACSRDQARTRSRSVW